MIFSQFCLNLQATSGDKIKQFSAFSNNPFAGEKPISGRIFSTLTDKWRIRKSWKLLYFVPNSSPQVYAKLRKNHILGCIVKFNFSFPHVTFFFVDPLSVNLSEVP